MNFTELFTSLLLFLPRLGTAIIIFLAFWLASRIWRSGMTRFGRTHCLSADLVNMMEQVSEAALMIFGAVTALGTLGIDVGAMIAGLGLIGFALGFALKDMLSNILAGFMILMYNPFVRGDRINVAGNEGRVVEINMRYTVLQEEGRRVLVPNATLFQNPVIVERSTPSRFPE